MAYPQISKWYVRKNPWIEGGKWLVLADYCDSVESDGPGKPGYPSKKAAMAVARERNSAMREQRISKL